MSSGFLTCHGYTWRSYVWSSPDTACEKRRKMAFSSASLPSHPSFPASGCELRSFIQPSIDAQCHLAGGKFGKVKTFPLLPPPSAPDSLARVDAGYRSPAQLCLPASVRFFIPGCACVFMGRWRAVKLHRGETLCVHVCVCVHGISKHSGNPATPTSRSPSPLPSLYPRGFSGVNG